MVWKFQMEIVLEANHLLGVTDGSQTLQHDAARRAENEWSRKHKSAKMYICAAIHEKLLQQLIKCKTADQMWLCLSTLHD
ncbi:hypothetical protein Mapa_004744 [Marchantia paleacea]|nr:hypothetical protein Mapa_004744 [Marchantia paleacea]